MKRSPILLTLLIYMFIIASCGKIDNPENRYTISYDGNNNTSGTPPADDKLYLAGAAVNVMDKASLKKTGYTFTGWNSLPNASGTDYSVNSQLIMPDHNIVLYAKWTPNTIPTYTVTYNGNGNTSGIAPSDPNNYLASDNVTILPQGDSLFKHAYRLQSWNTVDDGSGTTYNIGVTYPMPSENLVLFAIWNIVNPEADVIYVSSSASGNNDGTSWIDAFTDLQDALDIVIPGEEIWVSQGEYLPSEELGGVGDRYKAFKLVNNVSLYGGFRGDESLTTERNISQNESVLSGDAGTYRSYHVFNHTNLGLNSTAVLDGFTISGGLANGSSPHNNGGGMLNSGSSIANGSSPIIRNCTFKNNSSTGDGGAVYNSRYCNLTFNHCLFESNDTSTGNGGAIYTTRNNMTIDNCEFISNSSSTLSGGAIYINKQAATEISTITNSLFESNSAPTSGGSSQAGGAIYGNINPGVLSISNSEFKNNQSHYGAGIFVSTGNTTNRDLSAVSLNSNTFLQNQATFGAALFNEGHNSTIKNTYFKGNFASDKAGGIYFRSLSSQPMVINCLFSGNKADDSGGAIYINGNSPSITNSTIAANYSSLGGGIRSIATSVVTLNNSIVYDNQASTEGNQLHLSSGSTFNINYSAYANGLNDLHTEPGGTVNSSNSINSDPLFVDLVTPTELNTPNTSGNYTLPYTSPCIDVGNNAYITEDYDIRGLPWNRKMNKDGGAGVIDMGAYEYQ